MYGACFLLVTGTDEVRWPCNGILLGGFYDSVCHPFKCLEGTFYGAALLCIHMTGHTLSYSKNRVVRCRTRVMITPCSLCVLDVINLIPWWFLLGVYGRLVGSLLLFFPWFTGECGTHQSWLNSMIMYCRDVILLVCKTVGFWAHPESLLGKPLPITNPSPLH